MTYHCAVVVYDETRSMVLSRTATPEQAAEEVRAAAPLYPRVGWVWLCSPITVQAVPAEICRGGNE